MYYVTLYANVLRNPVCQCIRSMQWPAGGSQHARMTGGGGGESKRKRKRVISLDQRHAANIRERRRMYHLNEAFDRLRKRVPTFAYEKKLSRIETLKLAVTYITFMADLLQRQQQNHHMDGHEGRKQVL